MADRQVSFEVTPMAEENVGHTCIYIKDDEDRNFKICIECGHVAYRTDQELLNEYGNRIERILRREDCDDGA